MMTEAGMATLTLNRPQARNALSQGMLDTADAQEGIGAFIDKRHPVWRGC
jgi:enoyl-CoA hydratase/carnithine racemase